MGLKITYVEVRWGDIRRMHTDEGEVMGKRRLVVCIIAALTCGLLIGIFIGVFKSSPQREVMKGGEAVGGGFGKVMRLPLRNAGFVFVKGITLYAATGFKDSKNYTQLYRSTDKGMTWGLLFEDREKHRSRLIFVDSRGYIFYGAGSPPPARLYRSTDGGRTYEKVLEVDANDLQVSHSGGICEDKHGNLCIGELYPSNRTPRVYKSSDGGRSWQPIWSALPLQCHRLYSVRSIPSHALRRIA